MGKRGMKPTQAKKIREEKGIKDTKLATIRIKKGLSQSQLSVVSNVSLRSIQMYEQRVYSIDDVNLNTLSSLCLALDCKIEDIIEDKKLIEKFRMVK